MVLARIDPNQAKNNLKLVEISTKFRNLLFKANNPMPMEALTVVNSKTEKNTVSSVVNQK